MYQALYRKYRAKNFADVYGQDDIVTILKNSLITKKNSHAYIFSGPRGTGKTTLSRIIAKALNCSDLKNGEPCNECDNCRQINSNETVDIIEIDAASNNGVDEIREINNKVTLMPSYLRYKVYIIDEVHMLTVGAYNAFLKTLEEPPKHVIFILATTELNKVPITVLSRCQCFLLKKIGVDTIIERMRKICVVENVNIDDVVLEKIAQNADGALRDALSSLDQVLSFVDEGENIDINVYNKVNGVLSDEEIADFVELIIGGDVSKFLSVLSKMEKNGNDIIKVVSKAVLYLHNSVLNYYTKNDSSNYNMLFHIDLANEMNLMIPDLKNSFNPKIYFELKILSYIYSRKSENSKKYFPGNNFGNENTETNSNDKNNVEIVDDKLEKSGKNNENYFPGNNLVVEKTKKDVTNGETAGENSGKNVDSNENYFPGNNLSVDKSKEKQVSHNTSANISNVSAQLKKIRINNTFCDANKDALNVLKEDIDNLHSNKIENGNVISLLLDSTLRVASESHAIMSYKFESQVSLADQKLYEIEQVIMDILGMEIKLVFITDDEWDLTKNEYIVNMKNKVVYKYIDEPAEVIDKDGSVDNNPSSNLSEAEILFGDIVEYEN